MEEFQSLTMELGELAKKAIKEDINEEDTELVIAKTPSDTTDKTIVPRC